MQPNPTCCFCYEIIDLDQDRAATALVLAAVDPERGGHVRQKAYSHSGCLRDRVDPNVDLWWEF